MQTCWLSRSRQAACLLFFAGWGMDPEPFRSLACTDQDLLMVYDYRSLQNLDPVALLPGGYRRLSLIAWSMGVWVAGHLLADFRERFSTAVAVNGTLTPIDDRCGIPVEAYSTTLENLSSRTLTDFYRAMFVDQPGQERFLANPPRRPAEEIRAELAALRDHFHHFGAAADIYSRKLVGTKDRIISARAQIRSWGRDRCRTFPGAHFPFYDLSWPDLMGENE